MKVWGQWQIQRCLKAGVMCVSRINCTVRAPAQRNCKSHPTWFAPVWNSGSPIQQTSKPNPQFGTLRGLSRRTNDILLTLSVLNWIAWWPLRVVLDILCFSKNPVFLQFLVSAPKKFQVAANRTILILEGLPMAHLKAYVPNFQKHMWKRS